MSAHLLRHAATILRERVEAATPGVWKLWGMSVMADQDGTNNAATAVDVARTLYRDERGKPRTWDADYIAMMQPGVGRALADVLDESANVWDDIHEVICEDSQLDRLANLARLIVGEQS